MNNDQQLQEPIPFTLSGMNFQDGEAWESEWCDNCYRRKYYCNIFIKTMFGEHWKNQIVLIDNNIVCLSFKHKQDHKPKPRKKPEEIWLDFAWFPNTALEPPNTAQNVLPISKAKITDKMEILAISGLIWGYLRPPRNQTNPN